MAVTKASKCMKYEYILIKIPNYIDLNMNEFLFDSYAESFC